MTHRLYYDDSYISEFDAQTVSCTETDRGFEVVLNRSAFYPGGGGQPCDTGCIGGVRVSEAFVRGGDIVHITDTPVSGNVRCEIDFDIRFRRMQNHTGEHIVSGLLCSTFGADNVGFHMGSEDVTLDINVEITKDDLRNIELLANRAIYENIPVNIFYPERDTLADLEFRSKKDFAEDETVRIVEICGYDRCACAATHVKSAGEIGIIKFIGMIRYKGGMRIHMLCGGDALDDVLAKCDALDDAARSLSVKPVEIPEAVERLEERLGAVKVECAGLKRTIATKTAEHSESGIMFFDSFSAEALRIAVNEALRRFPNAAAFSGNDKDGYTFVLASAAGEAVKILQKMKTALKISGGGKDAMVSGKCFSAREEIEKTEL